MKTLKNINTKGGLKSSGIMEQMFAKKSKPMPKKGSSKKGC